MGVMRSMTEGLLLSASGAMFDLGQSVKRVRPDTRLDWRDPNMPCIRVTENVWSGELTSELVPPPEVQAEARKDLKHAQLPIYKMDPSYWWVKQAQFEKLERQAKKVQLGGFPMDCLDTCMTPMLCIYAGCKNGPAKPD